MVTKKKILKTCCKGHKYYKSSDCPTCPKCEAERKLEIGFLSLLAAPAQRALAGKGINSLEQFSSFTEAEILKLHGFGPSSLPILKSELQKNKLSFKTNNPKKTISKISYKNIDDYIVQQPIEVQPKLEKLRQTIKRAVPDAEEVISYQMPAFKYFGILIFFAVFKKHYSVFIRPRFMEVFKSELIGYKTSKSAINIPLDKPVPVQLITKIVKYIAKFNRDKATKLN